MTCAQEGYRKSDKGEEKTAGFDRLTDFGLNEEIKRRAHQHRKNDAYS
jgi:hypothetical protein